MNHLQTTHTKDLLPPKLQKKVERVEEIMEQETKKMKPKPEKKKKVGERLSKSQVKTKFTGKHKPQLSDAVERKCAICGRKSFSAWAFVKVGKKMKRKGAEKLTQKDFICRDSKTCKEKK